MKIKGIEGLSGSDIAREIERGGKFVQYGYCVSILILTFRRSSDIYFIKGGNSGISNGLVFSLISLTFGW